MNTEQLTIVAASTEYDFTDTILNAPVLLRAKSSNSGIIYVGGEGVLTTTGFPLAAGEAVIFDYVGNAGDMHVIGDTQNDVISYVTLFV